MRPKYLFGEFELNPASRELLRNGQPVALRPKSLDCLVYLIEHRDRAVGRDELISAVWGRIDASDTVVAQTLLRARKALDDTGNQQVMIRTLPRFGYRWVAPVREVATAWDIGAEDTIDGGRAGDIRSSTLYAEGDSETAANDDEGEAATVDGLDVDALGIDERDVDAGDVDAVDLDVADMHGLDVHQRDDDAPLALQAQTIGPEAGEAAVLAPATGRQRRFPRLVLAVLVAVVVALALGALWYSRHKGTGPMRAADDAVLVMPVSVVPMDSENAWVRLGGMDYMAARLRGSGINVLPSEQALRLGAAIEGDTPAVARTKLLALSGARWIAMPEARQDGARWRIRLHLFGQEGERWVEAQGNTALTASAEAADAWLRQLGGQGEKAPPPSPMIERLHRLDAEILEGRLQEARRLVRSWPAAERSDPRVLYREGRLEFRAANLDTSAVLFQRALDHASQTDAETRVGALLGLGGVERNRGNFAAAELRFTQALALAETLPPDHVNSRLVGFAYQGRGIVHAQQGDLDASIRDMGQARVWIQRSGDLVAMAVNGHNLGKAEQLRGDYLQALREYDRSIEIFERFRVEDYLANSLHEKADLQLAFARPGEAWDSARRAADLAPKLEDDGLAVLVLATKARIQLAQGRLREAGDTFSRMRSRGARDDDPVLGELLLRLYLARGELARARVLLGAGPPSKDTADSLMLAAVQVALRGGDLAMARSWLSSDASIEEQDARYHTVALALGRALIARAEGDAAIALRQAGLAADVVGMSPDAEIQTGVVQAMVMLDARQYDAASAIMGRLEKYADTDYRVAWAMQALYRALGDQGAAAAALGRANALRGDRDIAIPPVL